MATLHSKRPPSSTAPSSATSSPGHRHPSCTARIINPPTQHKAPSPLHRSPAAPRHSPTPTHPQLSPLPRCAFSPGASPRSSPETSKAPAAAGHLLSILSIGFGIACAAERSRAGTLDIELHGGMHGHGVQMAAPVLGEARPIAPWRRQQAPRGLGRRKESDRSGPLSASSSTSAQGEPR